MGGLQTRPGTLDDYVISEVARSYGWMKPTPDDVMLDVGGNIGSVASWAADLGCRVTSYEPDPDNFRMLCLNSPRSFNVQAALVVGSETEVTLFLNRGKNKGAHSLHIKRGRDEVRVPAVNFTEAFFRVKPTLLKVDCEGSEYDLLEGPSLPGVRALAVEYHLTQRAWRDLRAPKLHLSLLNRGFECTRQPKFAGKNWTTLGWYVR